MSYCRWSSSNWRSDVYVYEHCEGGFTTHVAGRKRVIQPIPDIPIHWLPNFGGKFSKDERKVVYPTKMRKIAAYCIFWCWGRWHDVHTWSLDRIPLKDIGLPHDGESFSDDTADECANRLESLRAIGYFVPQFAIDALREESAP